jgi:hypothetical protein
MEVKWHTGVKLHARLNCAAMRIDYHRFTDFGKACAI